MLKIVKQTVFFLILALHSGCAFLLPTKNLNLSNLTPKQRKYLRGVFHVHSVYSNDSRAALDRITAMAEKSRLDFVIVTDHNTIAGRDMYQAPDDPRIPLLIFGNEITTDDGHLIALGVNKEPDPRMSSQELIDWIHRHDGYAVIAHPLSSKRPWSNWEARDIDGIEVYNFGHALYATNKFKLATTSLLLWPNLFLNTNLESPKNTLQLWDSLLSSQQLTALAASDAHLKLVDAPGVRGVFRQALRAVTLYAQTKQHNEKAILHGLMRGDSFIVFESLGTAFDFSFKAITSIKSYHPNETIPANLSPTFSVIAPNAEGIRLLRNGHLAKQTDGQSLSYLGRESGAYRVEVYRNKKIWIISNPIFVKRN